jgi:hypothetical protein
MISIEYVLIFILLVIIFLIKNDEQNQKDTESQSNNEKQENNESHDNESQIEHFIDSNFNICDERDCTCLKLHTAPDGTCTEERISNIPEVPKYEDNIFYNKKALNNIKYPKKRPYDILVFIGDNMKNKDNGLPFAPPKDIKNLFHIENKITSNDTTTTELFEIFERAIDIISYFDGKSKSYLKYMILNTKNLSKDRKIMKSFGIDFKKSPGIFLYNENTKNLKPFLLQKVGLEKQCDILERLLVFISNGDCGFISYLNYLHDPYYGMRFEYNSDNKKWRPNLIQGITPLPPGTGMCSLIDKEHIPEEYDCKKIQI